MSRIKKRFEKLIGENSAKWDEVQTILRYYDFEIEPPTGGGSHWKVSHPAITYPQTISVHNNRITKTYIDIVVDMVEQISETGE